MQKELAALVAHDIKNSLALLEVDLEQLNHHDGLPVEARRAYQRCVELKERLIAFLTLYKSEQGNLRTAVREVDLLEFLEELIASSQSVMLGANKHGHPIEVSMAESRIRVAPDVKHRGIGFFDEYLLDMALESALNNAVRFAHARVELWFEQTTESLVFHVQDDGPGIEVQQGGAERAVAEHSSSTGLGIALCRAVVAAHGPGCVTLENAPGGGAAFTLALPALAHL
jgi:signal transduction histidine kinase